MAATALYLPEEILCQIVAHLRLPSAITIGEKRNPDFELLSDCDQAIKLQLSTLACLSRTSRILHRIVEPVLYHTYPGFRIANARSFINTLARKSGCADSVREIVIDKWQHDERYYEHPIDRSPQSFDAQRLQYARDLRSITSCYHTGLGSVVGEELDRGRPDVILTALVLLCNDIEVLDVSVVCKPDRASREQSRRTESTPFLLDMLPVYVWIRESHKRYQRIRRMAVRLEDGDMSFGSTFAKRMLLMPNVKSFSAWRIRCCALIPLRDPGAPDEPWLGLRSIELRECQMSEKLLARLLQRAPNLRELDLHWASANHELMSYRTIAAYLNTLGADLESVRLNTRNCYCREFEPLVDFYEAQDEPLGNLGQMVRLKHLAVTPHAPIGNDRYSGPSHEVVRYLPANLTTLQILGPTREDPDVALTGTIYRHLAPILQDSSSKCPNLRRIDFQLAAYALDHSDVGHWQCDAAELDDLYGPGVDMSFTKQ